MDETPNDRKILEGDAAAEALAWPGGVRARRRGAAGPRSAELLFYGLGSWEVDPVLTRFAADVDRPVRRVVSVERYNAPDRAMLEQVTRRDTTALGGGA